MRQIYILIGIIRIIVNYSTTIINNRNTFFFLIDTGLYIVLLDMFHYIIITNIYRRINVRPLCALSYIGVHRVIAQILISYRRTLFESNSATCWCMDRMQLRVRDALATTFNLNRSIVF